MSRTNTIFVQGNDLSDKYSSKCMKSFNWPLSYRTVTTSDNSGEFLYFYKELSRKFPSATEGPFSMFSSDASFVCILIAHPELSSLKVKSSNSLVLDKSLSKIFTSSESLEAASILV